MTKEITKRDTGIFHEANTGLMLDCFYVPAYRSDFDCSINTMQQCYTSSSRDFTQSSHSHSMPSASSSSSSGGK